MKKNNSDQTISKEKIANYIQNKRDKLLKQWYYQNNWENPMNTLRNEVRNDASLESNKQKIVHQILSILPRDPLRGQHEPLPNYLAWWTKESMTNNMLSKINQRIMTEQEYNNILQQVEKYWSILPDTKIRNRDFGGARWSLILSLSTGKIYDVESDSWTELLKDYKGKQYYSSRSWMSGAWYIYAGKSSLVYLPMMRVDVAHPWSEGWLQEINGLDMAVLTNRGAVNEEYPTVIKNCAWVDVVLLSQKEHLSPEGSGKLLGEVIKSKWACLEQQLPIKTFITEYYDENLEKQTLSFTYRTNMDPKDIKFNDIGKWFLGIKRWFDVESTWKFIENMAGIRKYKDKYVRLGMFGLIKEIFEEHPIKEDQDKLYIDEWEVGDANRIEHTKIEIPLSTDYTWNINGWEIKDGLAVKKRKNDKNIETSWYQFEQICAEHGINHQYIYEHRENDVPSLITCDLVYEKKMSEIHPDFVNLGREYMEYEASIPEEIFTIYPRSYWQEYMARKLFEKAYNERSNTNNRPEDKQKEMIMDFLETSPTQKIMMKDSYAVGNCEPWTKWFIRAFGLDEDWVSTKDLLKHTHLDRMMKESRFRAVLLKKVLEWVSI